MITSYASQYTSQWCVKTGIMTALQIQHTLLFHFPVLQDSFFLLHLLQYYYRYRPADYAGIVLSVIGTCNHLVYY